MAEKLNRHVEGNTASRDLILSSTTQVVEFLYPVKPGGKRKGLGEELATQLPQSVTFFHEVSFGSSAEKVRINGKIPNLRPKYSRKPWDSMSKDLEKLMMETMDWARQVMQVQNKESSLKILVMNVTIFIVFCNPQVELFSCKMQQMIRLLVIIWIFDDYLDVDSCSQITYEDMSQARTKLIDILKGKYDKEFLNSQNIRLSDGIGKLESIAIFSQLVDGLIDVRKECLNIFPDFDQRSQGVIRGLEQFLNSAEWHCLTRLDKTYSFEMFRRFRAADSAAEVSVEFFALQKGILIPVEVRSHLVFQRYIDLVTDIIGFTNDVLGLTKDSNTHDSSEGDRDNVVVFQILEKNTKPGTALAQTVHDIQEMFADLMRLKVALLKAFPDQPDVQAYVDTVESAIDGHLWIYTLGPRYSINDNITITDNQGGSE